MSNNPQDEFGPNTYFDTNVGRLTIKLLPGEYYVSGRDVVLVTVLGSCVSACIRDTRIAAGGMNHFMLPADGRETPGPMSESARYGVYAMEVLINELLKLGAKRQTLEAKVFGGGNVLAGLTQANVGERNAAFVLEFLRAERITLVAQDLLDIYPRKLYFFPQTGRVRVKQLRAMHNDTIVRRERDYDERLRKTHVGGDVELFD